MSQEPQPADNSQNEDAPATDTSNPDPSPEIQNTNQTYLINLTEKLVSTQAQIDLLNHLQAEHLKQQELTRSLSRNPNQSAPLSQLEAFLDSSHISPLVNLSTYEKVLKITKIPIELLDPSDTSGQTLWDYVPKNLQEELKAHLETAKTQEAIQQSLKSQVERYSPKLWDDYLQKEAATQHETLTLLRQQLLGINDPEADQEFLPELPRTKHTEALLCLEKTRILVGALTADSEQTRKEAEAVALQVLGPDDFSLYKDQVTHLQNLLDSRRTHPNAPLEDPADQLLSNSFKTIFPNGLSKGQISTLQTTFQQLSQNPPQDIDDVKNQTISCIIATLSVHQQGLKASICNDFQSIRKTKDAEIANAQNLSETPNHQNPNDRTASEGTNDPGETPNQQNPNPKTDEKTKGKKADKKVLAGLLNVENLKNILKHSSQALALYKGAQKFICNQSHQDPQNNYGSRGETMEEFKKMGVNAMDQM